MALGSLGAVAYDIVAQDKTKTALDSAGSRAEKIGKTGLVVGAGMTAVGVGSKLMADNINESYLTFDTAMAEVKSLGGLTNEQFEEMRVNAIDISKELPLSATSVANGFYMMRSAGFDAGKVIAELPAIADMAVAGDLDMADAVNATTMVLDSYGDSAGNTADITNILMGTVQGFKTTLPELQTQLSKNIGVAATLGISFDELAAMSGMLKKDFVGAEEAGTAMKTMLMRLADPKVAEKLDEMGVATIDAEGNFIGMQSILDGLSTKLEDAGGNVEQMALLQGIFGTEGVRAAMSLIRQKDELAAYTGDVSSGTAVQEALNAQLDSTASQLEIANNKMDAAKIALGEGMAPATLLTADLMSGFADVLGGMPKPLQTVIGSGMKLSEAFIGIGPMFMAIGPIMSAFSAIQSGTMVPSLFAHAGAAWAAVAPYLAIILPIIAVVAILYILEKKFGVVTKVVEIAKETFGNLVDFLKGGFTDKVEGVKNLIGMLGDKLLIFLGPIGLVIYAFKNWEEILGIVTDIFDSIMGYIGGLYSKFKDAGANIVQSLIDGIKSLIGKPIEIIEGLMEDIWGLLPMTSPAKKGPLAKLPDWESYLVEPIEAVKISPKTLFSSEGGIAGSATAGGNIDNTITIGTVNLSRDYDFDALMRDIEMYQRDKRVQRGGI